VLSTAKAKARRRAATSKVTARDFQPPSVPTDGGFFLRCWQRTGMRPPNRSTRKPSARTKRRLLEAAAEIFAEQGYDATPIREISEKADANIAAINYHFEDKASFYLAVFQYARSAAESAALRGSADARLRQFVTARLRAGQDHQGWYERLLSRELLIPSSAHDTIQPEVEILREELRSIVRELIGSLASNGEVSFTADSILGLCAFYQHSRVADNPAALPQRVAAFALAGIASRRQQLEAEA
jgi:AcrR family transcriptional regulator